MNRRKHIFPRLGTTAIAFLAMIPGEPANAVSLGDGFVGRRIQDAADHPELSFPTDFWRSEFFNNPDSTARPSPSRLEDGGRPGSPPSTMQNTPPGILVARLDEELFQQGTATDFDSGVTDTDADNRVALSEWDLVASHAMRAAGGKTAHQGPSAITVIVGVVGVMVVFGAYFRQSGHP